MRTIVVFYAWQSDRPNNVNRGFIEKALEDAVKQFNASSKEIEVKIDQDTQGVSGMPPVSQTILEKIAKCDVFLPDLTFVSSFGDGAKKGRGAPNPNVLIEFGHALSVKGHNFLMPVMNAAFGGPDGLPFDMGHLRNPILFRASPSDNADALRDERNRLSRELLNELTVTIRTIPIAAIEPTITKEMRSIAEERHIHRLNIFPQLIPVQLINGPKLLMHFFPASSIDESKELDFALVNEQSRGFIPFDFTHLVSKPDVHTWSFFDPPSPDRKGMFPGRIEPAPGQSMWFAELSRHGSVEAITMIDTIGMPSDAGPISIEGSILEAIVVRTAERIVATLVALKIEAPAVVQTSLLEVRDCNVLLGRLHGRFTRQPIMLPEIILESFEPPLANSLRPVLDAILRAAGIANGSPSFATGTWAGYPKP